MNTKKVVISVALDEELLRELDFCAYKAHCSRSAFLRTILYEKFFDDEGSDE